MGYDQHDQPNSSGTLVAVIGVGLVLAILAILAIIAVAAVGLYWVRSETQQAQADAMEQRAMVLAELHRTGVEAQQRDAMAQLEQSRIAAASDPRLNFVLNLDREGNIRVGDETIGLDELKTRLEKSKAESSNGFLARIIADADCPSRHIKSVVAVFGEVGDIAWDIVSPENADAPTELNNVAK